MGRGGSTEEAQVKAFRAPGLWEVGPPFAGHSSADRRLNRVPARRAPAVPACLRWAGDARRDVVTALAPVLFGRAVEGAALVARRVTAAIAAVQIGQRTDRGPTAAIAHGNPGAGGPPGWMWVLVGVLAIALLGLIGYIAM